MDTEQTLAYVQASAAALGLRLDAARALRVAGHLQRTADLAALLDAEALTLHDEIAAIYCPAPFPGAADAPPPP